MNECIASTRRTCGCAHAITAVKPEWTMRDYLGAVAVRANIGRMNYRVSPGLYTIGKPTEESPVFVTSNYKLTFDHVRRALKDIDAWVLVLDTNGVNVWCAAGKGLFSTSELCRRIEEVKLGERVTHRQLILPQLGAVGVAAHEVVKTTGFNVTYGPVRAEDIPAWLGAGRKKDATMRTVRFNMVDRMTLVPVEITNAKTNALVLIAVALMLALVKVRGIGGLTPVFAGYAVQMLGALMAAAVFVPALLPWLPTKSFSIKGAVTGILWTAAMAAVAANHSGSAFWSAFSGVWTLTGAMLTSAAVAAFVGLNFTGATVYTSQSGTMLETRRALPLIGIAAAAGAILQIVGAIQGE